MDQNLDPGMADLEVFDWSQTEGLTGDRSRPVPVIRFAFMSSPK